MSKNIKQTETQLLLPIITEKAPICSCGICGMPVKWNKKYRRYNTYIAGHQTRVLWKNPIYRDKVCAYLKSQELRDIQARSNERLRQDSTHRDKISNIVKELWENPEYREKITRKTTERTQTDENREKFTNFQNELCKSPEHRQFLSKISRENWQNPEYREKHSERLRKRWEKSEYRNMMTIKAKERWQNPEFVAKVFSGCKRSPNIPESLLLSLTPENVEYVGNGSFWKTLKLNLDNGQTITVHKNPDFKVKGQKKVIEFNGFHWHKNDYPDEVWQKSWAKIGFECLIIWDHEIVEMDVVLDRIKNFIEVSTYHEDEDCVRLEVSR